MHACARLSHAISLLFSLCGWQLDNGIDHLDKLETLGKSQKDLAFVSGFTGNRGLFEDKLDVSH